MSQKTIILIVTLFVLIVAGMFIFAHLKQSEMDNVIKPETVSVQEIVPYSDITRIDAKHYFIEGTHTLVGEVAFPTLCDLLDTEAFVAESYPEQVTVNFSVVNNSEDCAQVQTAQRFKVSFIASEEASISGQFMGREIILNLIPAGPNEVPEEFELFIKG